MFTDLAVLIAEALVHFRLLLFMSNNDRLICIHYFAQYPVLG